MKNFGILWVLSIFCMQLFSCKQKRTSTDSDTSIRSSDAIASSVVDTVCGFHKLPLTMQDKLPSGIGNIIGTCLFENNIYVISSGLNKVFTVDLTNNNFEEEQRLNKVIDSVVHLYGGISKLYVDRNGYFIGFDHGFIGLDHAYDEKYHAKLESGLNLFEMFTNDRFSVISSGNTTVYDKTNGKMRLVFPSNDYEGDQNYYKSDDGIYGGVKTIIELKYMGDSIVLEKEIDPATSKIAKQLPFQEGMYPVFIARNYIVWFFYGKRENLVITDSKMDRILKSISFNKTDLSTSNQFEMNLHEHYWDFSIDVKDNKFYITHYNNNALNVYSGCIKIEE